MQSSLKNSTNFQTTLQQNAIKKMDIIPYSTKTFFDPGWIIFNAGNRNDVFVNISNVLATVIPSPDQKTCRLTYEYTITSRRHLNNPTWFDLPYLKIIFKNNAGGNIYTWGFFVNVDCSQMGKPATDSINLQFNIFDDVTNISTDLSLSSNLWYPC
ncbi:hypothetical protein [Bacillus cereus]|uniref:hypothetical protein n=1 Tax=Bacillus cereus TaxID=1396 RepID=UPI000B4BC34B|nr:hypothetical protein [Bacillus cereus]